MGAELIARIHQGPKILDLSSKDEIVSHALRIKQELQGREDLEERYGICSEYLADLSPETVLSDLLYVWAGRARDVELRDFEESRTLVAGMTSWGDWPEGYGWTALQNAEILGMLDMLGID